MNIFRNDEMNSKLFLFVNPYEVNPGNSRIQRHHVNEATVPQISPLSSKTDSGDLISSECQPAPSEVKMEMEEFSDLGDLIPLLRGKKFVMDEADLPMESEGVIDFADRSYPSPILGDFAGMTQESRKCENNQFYIDNQHINLEDLLDNNLRVLQTELSSEQADSDAATLEVANSKDERTSNMFNYKNDYCLDDHPYSYVSSSPSEVSSTAQPSPIGTPRPVEQKLDLSFKFFMDDTLNTPDILESVVSLEDDRFNFLRSPVKAPTPPIQKEPQPQQPILNTSNSVTTVARKRKYEEDEDYNPQPKKRVSKKVLQIVEVDSDSEDEYIPNVKTKKGRSTRVSSFSSESSKDSSVSKYRELRDKNNEASRKSRMKRRVKEQEMETEMQDLEMRNIKLKVEVEELQRMVDTFRSNLFKVMIKK